MKGTNAARSRAGSTEDVLSNVSPESCTTISESQFAVQFDQKVITELQSMGRNTGYRLHLEDRSVKVSLVKCTL